jgi:hypothetical protein
MDMKRRNILAMMMTAMGLAGAADEDKFALKYSNGIAFSEFRGYEAWQSVAPSQPGDEIKIISGNPVMINAYKAGIPGNGVAVPDGAMIAKIEWSKKKNPDFPSATVPDTLNRIGFMVKDSKRFPDTDGWGYAQFVYQPSTNTFKQETTDPLAAKNYCHQCHTRVKSKDFVFTAYPVR